ncbi:peptidoglycan editing factor PgeF [Massilia atriviolacea]|uniref:Purine nucleoside phosphorylase n=1 Tax=Massilia atriviolacea TaxID=2495579 RepID=A0A430HCQ3_9BURK|nr:peptidoglycan editing factor PgeF [Massilia atriviolacea]RSZ55293.1 peptidoglycan editing factor PgeF [Massilia atriviolacea]
MSGVHVITPDWPDLPATVGAMATTRSGGVSPAPYDDGAGGGGLNLGNHVGDDPVLVGLNRARLRQALPGEPAWISQVHGVGVVDAATVEQGQPVQVGDASIAAAPGVVCAIMTADCLPVLFASIDGKVVGAAHAGWRGLAAGVLGETVASMRASGAGEITAWLGPAIGPSQFEVGSDVLDSFVGAARDAAEAASITQAFAGLAGHPGKYLADIYLLARIVLARDGVHRVSGGTYCTASERGRFYSYRRDHVTGRQASLIWIK